jgi:hypothetical protein
MRTLHNLRHAAAVPLPMLIFLFLGHMLLASTATLHAQTVPDFDLQTYTSFLASHQNMTPDQLLALHPGGTFVKTAPTAFSTAGWFDRINSWYVLTPDEKTLLGRHGFVVTERIRPKSFGDEFLTIYTADLPVFVSTDAILHALHMSYDAILMTTEEQVLIPKLVTLLASLQVQIPGLATRYANDTRMEPALADLDLYLTVARRLLGQTVAPYFLGTTAASDEILNMIAGGQPVKGAAPLFADSLRWVDYSQFTPRGHYTRSKALTQYFQSMIWMGRTEFYLSAPRNTLETYNDAQIQRQTIAAMLLLEAFDLAGSTGTLNEIDDAIRFFVGESDNVTVACLKGLAAELGLAKANELLDLARFNEFQTALLEKGWAYQRILSQMLSSGSFLATDQIQPASSFLLMGQRFVIDSYVTGSVVYDKIIYQNTQVRRMLPSTLDVLFALGNDASGQLLVPELERYHYATNLAALRYLVEAYEPSFWKSTFYNGWLDAIRALNPPPDRTTLPPFMRTAAWWQEKMNTQLASWAQLRHDNLLYVKQSYSGMPVCAFPYSYVEPVPQFFRNVSRLADTAAAWFARSSPTELRYVASYFTNMKNTTDTLAAIAEKELAGQSMSDAEAGFMSRMIFKSQLCGPQINGWYSRLFFQVMTATDEDLVVADVHTSPADEAGGLVGWVLHAGTGPLNLAFLVADIPGAGPVAFVGPVMSYHEFVSTNFKRLTDEEWKAQYVGVRSSRPTWVNVYLADETGKTRGDGPTLLTGVPSDPADISLPQTIMMAQNYPNPFNSATVIPVIVPQGNDPGRVDIAVYDIQGRRIRQLVNEHLPPGSYLVRWDGRSDDGRPIASGVYVSMLKAQGSVQTEKMVLIR